jgi:hypothetical protein
VSQLSPAPQRRSLDDTIAELNTHHSSGGGGGGGKMNVRNALEESRLETSLDTTQDNYSDRVSTKTSLIKFILLTQLTLGQYKPVYNFLKCQPL